MAFDWGALAQAVVGAYGIMRSEKAAGEARKTVREGEAGQQKIYGLDLAAKREIADKLSAIMRGDYRSLEPAFTALDENVESQLQNEMDAITVSERKSMRLIADTATGATKIRLLKNLAEGAQDKRATALAAARRKKVTTRESMKADVTQYARTALPSIFSQGAALQVPSQNVQFGLQAMLSNAQNAQAQMKYLTDVLSSTKTQPSTVIYTGNAPGVVPTTTARSGLVQREQSYKQYPYTGGD